jgi:hypothetical protein
MSEIDVLFMVNVVENDVPFVQETLKLVGAVLEDAQFSEVPHLGD